MNLLRGIRRPKPMKAMRDDDNILGYNLYADGRIQAIKQGSGMYGAGFGSNAFSETAFGTQIALSQSTFGWSAAYSVSTWVYRCIEVRKSAIHRMPWNVYSKRTKQPNPKHPLAVALKRNRQKLFKKIEQSQLLYGETFIEVAANDYGYRSDLYWLNNNGMAVLIGAGHIVGYSYTALQGGDPQNFEPDQLAFMKTDNPFNDLRGMSPTEVIMDEVAIDKDVARVVRAYYANDTRVGVIFIPKTNLLPQDQERFMQFFKRDNQGPDKAGKPVIMPQDMTVERIQEPATLDDAQLRESTRREIASGYGVPLALAGAWDEANYDSVDTQRKSFYEETIIPECDNIADFVNTDLMPFFDDSGNFYFGYDFTSILALTEDAQKKNDIYSNRLVSGGITRAEFRKALGHPVRPSDDVYYIPAGLTIVPADESALVTPQTNEVTETPQAQEQPPQAPTVERPQEPPKQLPAQQPPKQIAPPQKTAQDELAAWEKKAINTNALKATGFVAYIVPRNLQTDIRSALVAAGKTADRATIKAIFTDAREALKWEESKHPREDNGRFGHGGGSSGGSHDESSSPKPDWQHTLDNMSPEQRQRLAQSLGLSNAAPAASPAAEAPQPATVHNMTRDEADQHSKAQVKKLSKDEIHGVKLYSDNTQYEAINSAFRKSGNVNNLPAGMQNTAKQLDSALAKSSLPNDTTLYRARQHMPTDWKVGTVISDKAYVSTSTELKQAEEFAGVGHTGPIMRIKAPKGTKGLFTSSVSEFPEESEFLMPRGQKFKITGITKTGSKTFVDMELAA